MAKLNESKEALPVSFLTDFISKGWEEVGYLKADIEAIKEAYKNTDKIAELIQGLIDAYLVCIGQLELHLHDKNYIEYPKDSGLAGSKVQKESLAEGVDIHIEGNEVTIADASGEEVATMPIEPSEEKSEIPTKATDENAESDENVPPVVAEIEPVVVSTEETSAEPFENMFSFDAPEVSVEKPAAVGDTFDYFVDFDDPDMSQPALTDKDIYGEGEPEIPNEKIDDDIEKEKNKIDD